jgi:hypothetical protein
MRLTKNDGKIGVALEVLKHVKLKRDDVMVNTYSNCREQGLFLIQGFGLHEGCKIGQERAISFAEHRNSDNIVVQFGLQDDFNDYGVFKTEEKYQTCKKYFGYNEHEKAGEFITKWLKGEIQ